MTKQEYFMRLTANALATSVFFAFISVPVFAQNADTPIESSAGDEFRDWQEKRGQRVGLDETRDSVLKSKVRINATGSAAESVKR